MKFQFTILLLVASLLQVQATPEYYCPLTVLRKDCRAASLCKLQKKRNGKVVCVPKPTPEPTVSAINVDCASMGRKKCRNNDWACGLKVTKKGGRIVNVNCFNLVTGTPTTTSPTAATPSPTVPTGSPTTNAPTAPTTVPLCGEDTYHNAKAYCAD
eukprot:CAMPEP_0204888882 /NCGR_PEP_ID=MMETSP1349-20130617/21427_1 /ASSEMBLY_ACC=CAM_ASM_000710 /TAXON_ID=215587 /ORGANISM="Aplanochytrium stocchinoi, Strain GSBS06" /LENGTH=155 /DNA_ID=CAMNT_0052052643 /DNA_START=147 /DNA_END=611 /DNA_ORIENTATION=+